MILRLIKGSKEIVLPVKKIGSHNNQGIEPALYSMQNEVRKLFICLQSEGNKFSFVCKIK
jgi:hypothetical protein